MGQLCQRVGLVHELGKLGASEELPHSRDHRPDVDQRGGRGGGRVHLSGHAFLDDALHPEQSDTDLILDKLAHCSDSAVAQMVDVVRADDAVVNLDHPPQQGNDVAGRESQFSEVVSVVNVQLAVELVASHSAQIVSPGVEEQIFQQVLGVLHVGRLAGAQPSIELQQRLFLSGDAGVLVDGGPHVLVFFAGVHIFKQVHEVCVSRKTHCPQQCGDGSFALAVHLDG